MKRFIVSTLADVSKKNSNRKEVCILLSREETHHLKHVMRMKEGSECLLFDRSGNECVSRIHRFLPDGRAEALLLEWAPRAPKAALELTVAQAIPQHRKMDSIVEKAAELGIFELIPMMTERTAVRFSSENRKKVRERWIRIRDQALKQSRSARAPVIAEVTSFRDLWAGRSACDRIFVLHPSDEALSIHDLLIPSPFLSPEVGSAGLNLRYRLMGGGKGEGEQVHRILLVIGPEGGFSPAELDFARSHRAELVRLGSGILKTDTAFVAAASFFLWTQ